MRALYSLAHFLDFLKVALKSSLFHPSKPKPRNTQKLTCKLIHANYYFLLASYYFSRHLQIDVFGSQFGPFVINKTFIMLTCIWISDHFGLLLKQKAAIELGASHEILKLC